MGCSQVIQGKHKDHVSKQVKPQLGFDVWHALQLVHLWSGGSWGSQRYSRSPEGTLTRGIKSKQSTTSSWLQSFRVKVFLSFCRGVCPHEQAVKRNLALHCRPQKSCPRPCSAKAHRRNSVKHNSPRGVRPHPCPWAGRCPPGAAWAVLASGQAPESEQHEDRGA